jgi:hypothetical protein
MFRDEFSAPPPDPPALQIPDLLSLSQSLLSLELINLRLPELDPNPTSDDDSKSGVSTPGSCSPLVTVLPSSLTRFSLTTPLGDGNASDLFRGMQELKKLKYLSIDTGNRLNISFDNFG